MRRARGKGSKGNKAPESEGGSGGKGEKGSKGYVILSFRVPTTSVRESGEGSEGVR